LPCLALARKRNKKERKKVKQKWFLLAEQGPWTAK
jgi:hypothetical protein